MTVTALRLPTIATPSEAAQIQANLQAAETALDEAVTCAAALLGQTLAAARTAGLHRVEIAPMLKRLHDTIGGSLDMQMHLQRYHSQSRKILGKLDLAELGWGDTGGSPDWTGATGA